MPRDTDDQTLVAPWPAQALWLVEQAEARRTLLFIACDEARLDQLAGAAPVFAGGRVEVLALPPWDVLPYDRVPPSAGVIGCRVRALSALARRGRGPGWCSPAPTRPCSGYGRRGPGKMRSWRWPKAGRCISMRSAPPWPSAATSTSMTGWTSRARSPSAARPPTCSFGDAHKARFADLASGKEAAHVLAMSATPIPRTLQEALVGLRDVSVIATAPMRRQPTRTYTLPFDPAVAREALMREHRRGGQSFVVCPRIGDLAPTKARLREAAPELRLVQAHGRMKPEALDDAMTGFANGEGDVLLSTTIIEAGLDIPRANTMVVMGADRFGLAQLHQLRGRVGRGQRRGLLHDGAGPPLE